MSNQHMHNQGQNLPNHEDNIGEISYLPVNNSYVSVCVMKYKFTTQLYHKDGTSQSRVFSPQTLSITLLHQRKHQDLHGMTSTINQCSFKQGIMPISRLIYVGPS
jgi:hypothetical protein